MTKNCGAVQGKDESQEAPWPSAGIRAFSIVFHISSRSAFNKLYS